jgi:hypothetical protein
MVDGVDDEVHGVELEKADGEGEELCIMGKIWR